jgi:hypothetical protein
MQDAIMYAIAKSRADDLQRASGATDAVREVRRARRDGAHRWRGLFRRGRARDGYAQRRRSLGTDGARVHLS